MIAGLLLALLSAALINIGFLMQHRGLQVGGDGGDGGSGGLAAQLRRAVRAPMWLGGQALGWGGFLIQIVAVAVAPLSLVQAFAAGGLALSVPIAAGLFHQRITRAQTGAVLMISAGLAVLPLGFSTARDRLSPGALAAAVAAAAVIGLAVARGPGDGAGRRRAVAAGLFYGLADAAIKAVSLRWRAHGAEALLSTWTIVAAGGTLAGFLAFQAALRDGGAVAAISLMNALAALAALGCGLAAFGESLGTGAPAVVAHAVAITVVLAGLPALAAAQAAMTEPPGPQRRRKRRAGALAGRIPLWERPR